ncbi:MAG: hypothetical protein ACI9UA_003883 [Pseudoalteromonas tetraodonis]
MGFEISIDRERERRNLSREGGANFCRVGWQAVKNGRTIGLSRDQDIAIPHPTALTRTYLRRLAVVIPQNATEALPAPDIACIPADFVARFDDPVPKALVVALRMVVGDELILSTL